MASDIKRARGTPTDAAPKGWRVALAFLVAPLLSTIIGSVVGAVALSSPYSAFWVRDALAGFHLLMAFGVVGAYALTLTLGVPAFLILRNIVRPTLLRCALVGGLVASPPGWLLFGGSMMEGGSVKQALTLPLLFGLGMIGGAAAWLIVFAGYKSRQATAALAFPPSADD